MTNEEAMTAAIKQRLNGDKNHGWGVDDSLYVIMSVIANETGAEKIDDFDKDNFVLLIKSFINPSQFRQALEKAGHLNEAKEKKTKRALKGLLKSL